MAINNNTTRLGMGMPRLTGRQFNDPMASSMSQEIARANYKKTFRSDYRVAELKKYVKKMVSSWSKEDKMAILAEYGNPSKGASDDAVVEALITNLKEGDLEILLKDIKMDESKLGKRVRDIRGQKRREASKFNTRTFEEAYQITKGAKNPREMFKALKKYDKSIKVPRYVRKKYGKLKKEIETVLKDTFNRVELTGLALKMDITFEDGTNQKELIQMIVNKTLLFVDLIMGTGKINYAAAFMDQEPYKEILKFTSFSWVVGVSGMSGTDLAGMRQTATSARYEMQRRKKEAFTMSNKTMNIGRRNIIDDALYAGGKVLGAPGALIEKLGQKSINKKTGKENFNILRAIPGLIGGLGGGIGGGLNWLRSGFTGPGMRAGAKAGFEGGSNAVSTFGDWLKNPFNKATRDIEKDAIKLQKSKEAEGKYKDDDLSRMDGQELFEEGAKYGLRPTKDLDKLRKEIRIQRAKSDVTDQKIRDKAKKLADEGKSLKGAEAARYAKIKAEEKEKAAESKTLFGTNIPYVRFSKAPTLISFPGADVKDLATFAVPVWVVNQTGSTGSATGPLSTIGDWAKNTLDIKTTDASGNKLTDASGKSAVSVKGKLVSAPDKLTSSDTGMSITGSGTKSYKMSEESAIFPGADDPHDPFLALGDKPTQALSVEGTRALRVFDMSSIIMAQQAERKKKADERRGQTTGADLMNNASLSMGINAVRQEPAIPVYITNKSVPTDVGKILIEVAKMLTRIMDPTGVTGEILGGVLESMVETGGGSSELLSLAGFATGGRGRASGFGKKSTHFISGDSLSKKPNPEQVSIDWSKKSYSVKPIPAFAEGGSGNSASGQYTRMTSSERNQPMSVGISSHLVTYERSLQGANDHGDRQALKVFAVNPGITDLVEVNGNNVSLITLVADMTGRLASIENLLSINNNQNTAIISSTAATASNVNKMRSGSSGSNLNPFTSGFPSDLDGILSGS